MLSRMADEAKLEAKIKELESDIRVLVQINKLLEPVRQASTRSSTPSDMRKECSRFFEKYRPDR
jgi:hypothetical protein